MNPNKETETRELVWNSDLLTHQSYSILNGLSTNKIRMQKGSEGQMEEREIPAVF